MDPLETHSSASIAAPSTTTKNWRRPRCPLCDEQNTQCAAVMWWNIIQPEKGTLSMNLESIILSERNGHEELLINR